MDIIFLNGASSAGKTSIVKQLQATLGNNYLHIGIDKFLGMMPEKSNDWVGETPTDGFYWQKIALANGAPAFKIAVGEYGKKINNAYRKTVANLAQMGLKLIVDDVTNGNEELQLWKKLLKPYKIVYIGVFCDVETLKAREIQRGNRKLGTAIEQYQRVHNGIEYDLTVDTGKFSVEQCAQMILSKCNKHN
ncbi:MAG: AAA family ATPase [Rhizobiales bacterium]|nr:chloramphenicol phosphotransferase CPT family protein [Hyphomicrobiales bacterium]NRB15224.1 AAA family ATPase [Hyphomicrobiales bacterium]